MAHVVVADAALDDLERMIVSHSLPTDARKRVRQAIEILQDFPLAGAALGGRWDGLRFLLGPWRWMIVIYRYDEETDTVEIAAIQDGRASTAATHGR